jgi:hypothetical protein
MDQDPQIRASNLWIRIPYPDPAVFVTDLQDANKKLTFEKSFSAYCFLKVHFHHFSKINSPKKSQNSSDLFLLFLLADRRIGWTNGQMDPDPNPGGPKTCGSGGSGFGSRSGTLDLPCMMTSILCTVAGGTVTPVR